MATLSYFAFLQNQNFVCILNSTESMGDRKCCSAFHSGFGAFKTLCSAAESNDDVASSSNRTSGSNKSAQQSLTFSVDRQIAASLGLLSRCPVRKILLDKLPSICLLVHSITTCSSKDLPRVRFCLMVSCRRIGS